MKYLAAISRENIRIAVAELEGLLGNALYQGHGIALVQRASTRLFGRLGYTNAVYRLLFTCALKDLPRRMKGFAWQSIYRENFCVRIHGSGLYSEKELAGYVWRAVRKPKVNLGNPRTKIEIFASGSQASVGLLLQTIEHDFEHRKAHLRPRLHPSSLHPKLARAMINMTGIAKGRILDPFCGTGGILIEAGLVGLKPAGYDIDEKMLERARENLDYYKIKGYELLKKDSRMLTRRENYVVTDLPYGRNTRADSQLYKKFILALDRILTKRAVIGFPSHVDCRRLLEKTALKLKGSFDYYLHKSLSKKIVVLERSSS